MDRRDFLKAAGTAAAVAVGGQARADGPQAAPAVIGRARQWVIALPQSLDTIEVRTAAERLSHHLQASLEGLAVSIDVSVSSGAEAVTTGLADLYVGLDSQHGDVHPALPIFSGLPLGYDMAPAAEAAWLDGPGRALWTAALDAADLVAMPLAHSGPSPGLFTSGVIEDGRATRGRRFAVRGPAGDALRLLGATVVAAEADLADTLETRGFAAAEPLFDPFRVVGAHALTPGLTPGGLRLSLGARGSFWRCLQPAERSSIEAIARDVHAASQALMAGRGETLAAVAAMRGYPAPSALPPSFERDVREAITAVLDTLADRDGLARRALGSRQRFAAALA